MSALKATGWVLNRPCCIARLSRPAKHQARQPLLRDSACRLNKSCFFGLFPRSRRKNSGLCYENSPSVCRRAGRVHPHGFTAWLTARSFCCQRLHRVSTLASWSWTYPVHPKSSPARTGSIPAADGSFVLKATNADLIGRTIRLETKGGVNRTSGIGRTRKITRNGRSC
jgi:hypothetical protein